MHDLAGLWGVNVALGPELRGEITLSHTEDGWQAKIDGIEAYAQDGDGPLTFDFPEGAGSFRLRQTPSAGRPSVGHWIQPARTADGCPYATPVHLVRTAEGAWKGQVAPLDDSIALYLLISRNDDGSLQAFVRDPSANLGVFFPIEEVQLDGDTVRLVRRGSSDYVTCKYEKDLDTLTATLPFYPVELKFTRRDRENASGFYPSPAANTCEYQPPSATGDGWQTCSLDAAGLDSGPLAALIQSILSTQTTGLATPYIQGLLVARHGKLVLEEYFYGFDRDRPHDMRSATKSLATMLVGIAIDKGAPFDVDTPVVTLFPQCLRLDNDSPQKRRITVRHLLTMTSGLECDDDDEGSLGNEDNMQSQQIQPDWYKYTLDLPSVREPGESAVYCSAGMNLLGGILAGSTGGWLPEFLYKHIASPLKFGPYHLFIAPVGDMYLGGGSHIRPRDFLKIGQVFLDGGVWNGRRVISEKWVEESLRPHAGLHAENDYGYGWHLTEYHMGDATYQAAYASGNGGQLLIIVPDLEIVVMFTAANYSNYPTWRRFRDEIVPQYILSAARP